MVVRERVRSDLVRDWSGGKVLPPSPLADQRSATGAIVEWIKLKRCALVLVRRDSRIDKWDRFSCLPHDQV